jgi:hypothetical protein
MRRFLNYVAGGGGPKVINPIGTFPVELALFSDTVVGADASTPAGWTSNRWPDSSGHGRHALIGLHGAPHLRTTGVNLTSKGTQVVEFLGVTQGLSSFMGATPISGALGWTAITYYKSLALSAGHNNNVFDCPVGKHWEFCANSNIAFNGYDRDTRVGFDLSPVGVTRKTFDPLATLGWHTSGMILNPPVNSASGTVVGILDGVVTTPTFATWTCELEQTLNVGNSSGSNSDLQGVLAALVIISQALTVGQYAGVVAYIRARLG